VVPFVGACGASIQAIYEGDVRFEHCMALDARPDVKPTLRQACWEEWIKFYTFGQTRDRVDYAGLRVAQLSTASDFDEGSWIPRSLAPGAAPDPTGLLAPPPMMIAKVDAGLEAGTPGADSTAKPEAAPPTSCADECKGSLAGCKQDCKSPGCGKACVAKHDRCLKRCP
jgi:hypothetical protein